MREIALQCLNAVDGAQTLRAAQSLLQRGKLVLSEVAKQLPGGQERKLKEKVW